MVVTPHPGMVVKPCVEEVSVLSFMGASAAANSVATGSSDNSNTSKHRHGQDDLEEDPREDEDNEDEENGPVATLVNTADYDSKGRCVHHPHVRLRKKKIFGGWKTLMSACPDCCVEELRRIRMVDEKKRKMTRKKLERANRNKGGSDQGHQGGGDGNVHPKLPANSSTRSVGSAPATASADISAMQGFPRRSPRSASVPPQNQLVSQPPSLLSQESFEPAPMLPGAATPRRSPSKRSPSQDSYRSASLSRRSPSQDSFRHGSSASGASSNMHRPPPPSKKAARTILSDGSTSTASLTESERQLSGSDRSGVVPGGPVLSTKIIPLSAHKEHVNMSLHRNQPSSAPPSSEKKARSKSSSSSNRSHKSGDQPRQPHSAMTQESPQLGTIHVRQMQWTDSKGDSGRYTGQVDTQFVPYGHGSMVYNDSTKTKEGKWENGRYLEEATSRSRSTSRTAKGGSRSRSRGRSTSQAGVRQRSASRQPQPVVAVFN